jgi:hypothetical protein
MAAPAPNYFAALDGFLVRPVPFQRIETYTRTRLPIRSWFAAQK